MTVLTEGNHTGEFLISEANGYRSRSGPEDIQLASGNNLVAGSVVELTAGEYVPVTVGGTDPVAILYAAVDATAADTDAVFIERDAEVAEARLTYPAAVDDDAKQDAVNVRLLAVGIKVV